jgi:AraC family transcriptional regulator, exoenzyme S synthesis regulatory protein ExsA
MIFDLYNNVRNNTAYNKLEGSDYIIVEYKCPVETEIFQLMCETPFLVYLVSGKKDWYVNEKKYECKAGDALFVRKGVYTTRQHFDEENCVLIFFMKDNFIRNFMRENLLTEFSRNGNDVQEQVFKIDVDEVLNSVFVTVFNYLRMKREIPRTLVELKFRELLFNIILNPAHQNLSVYFTSLLQHTGKTDLEEVMQKHFQHDLELEAFARLSDRSLSAFKRDFRNRFNQSPGRWLTEKRLEFANSLLLASDLSVSEVCYESGFRNTTHFNKAFKSRYQLPPHQYRIRQKAELLSK